LNTNERILNYLQKGNSITAIEALEEFGCFRLSARIWELREAGHEIESVTLKSGNKKFASYKLKV
jgi:hypothetical protein